MMKQSVLYPLILLSSVNPSFTGAIGHHPNHNVTFDFSKKTSSLRGGSGAASSSSSRRLAGHSRSLNIRFNQRWKDRNRFGEVEIPYSVSRVHFNEEEIRLIDVSVKALGEATGVVRFVKHDHQRVNIHVVDQGGCYSMVGRSPDGREQRLSLTKDCLKAGIIQHEFLHALGLEHEQNRPDRDSFVTIDWSNIQDKHLRNFEIGSKNEYPLFGTPYDYNSLMHYSRRDFAKNTNMDTIIPTNSSAQIGQRDGPTELDLIKVRLLYQCISGPRTLDEYLNSPCTKDCKCWDGAYGCNGDNHACHGNLVCSARYSGGLNADSVWRTHIRASRGSPNSTSPSPGSQSTKPPTLAETNSTEEVQMVNCEPKVTSFHSQVSSGVRVDLKHMTSQETRKLEQAFMAAYNKVAFQTCDSLFRTITKVKLVLHRRARRLRDSDLKGEIFQCQNKSDSINGGGGDSNTNTTVTGHCENCPVGNNGSFALFDDAFNGNPTGSDAIRDPMAMLFAVDGECRGCLVSSSGTSNLFDDAFDVPQGNEVVRNESLLYTSWSSTDPSICICPAGMSPSALGLGPTVTAFEEAFTEELEKLDQDGEIESLEPSAGHIFEGTQVACFGEIQEFFSHVYVELGIEASQVTDRLKKRMEGVFLATYNDLSFQACDEFFRVVAEVSLVIPDDAETSPFYFEVTGRCRNCHVSSNGYFTLFDDAFRRRKRSQRDRRAATSMFNGNRKINPLDYCLCPHGKEPGEEPPPSTEEFIIEFITNLVRSQEEEHKEEEAQTEEQADGGETGSFLLILVEDSIAPSRGVSLTFYPDVNYEGCNNLVDSVERWDISGRCSAASGMCPIPTGLFAAKDSCCFCGSKSGSGIWSLSNYGLTSSTEIHASILGPMDSITEYCLHLPWSDTTNGNNIIVYPCNDSPAQQWWVDSNGYIRSLVDSNKCIVGSGGTASDGSSLMIHDCIARDDRFVFSFPIRIGEGEHRGSALAKSGATEDQTLCVSVSPTKTMSIQYGTEEIPAPLVEFSSCTAERDDQGWIGVSWSEGDTETTDKSVQEDAKKDCKDSPKAWSDSRKYSCEWYGEDPTYRCRNFGSKFRRFGKTANQACCACEGGTKLNTQAIEVAENPILSRSCWDAPADWLDSVGDDCVWYEQVTSRCEIYGNQFPNKLGTTANQACCACGGGSNVEPPHEVELDPYCTDSPSHWTDVDNFSCEWYAEGQNCEVFGDDYAVDGRTAKTACCVCGGGIKNLRNDGFEVLESGASDVEDSPSTYGAHQPDSGVEHSTAEQDEENSPHGTVQEGHASSSNCKDSPEGWVDASGDGCQWYAKDSAHLCAVADRWADKEGMTARSTCCICGGGTSTTELSFDLTPAEKKWIPSDEP